MMSAGARHTIARQFGVAASIAAFVGTASAQSTAAGFPGKALRMVIALAPGGGVDTTGRLVAQKLSEAWGQQVVAENRPGAGGTIAADLVAKAPADGYTFLVTSVGHAISPVFYKQLPYDVHKSFAPIARFVVAPNVIVVHPSVPVKSIKELVAFATARPGELLFSTSGVGGPQHLTLELFNSLAGTKIVHVPYKGTAPSMLDLMGGRVSVSAASITSAMPHARSGKLRALAVTGARRAMAEPDLPTVAEAGLPGFANDIWYGAFAPAGLPKDLVAKLSAECVRVLGLREVQDRLLATGLEAAPLGADEFAAFFRQEVAKIGKIAAAAGIKPE
jgi:tripartite-type tricarboxylate transporter receptor subunit TctC